jgi:hypothetical protein
VAELKYLEQNETDILNEKGKQRLDKKKDEIDQLKSAINRKQQELYTFEAEVNEQVESEILEIANLFETELRKEMQQTKSQAIKCDQLSAENGALVKQTASAVQEKTSYQKNVEDLKLIVHNLKQDLANLDAELKQRHQTELDEDEQIEQLMRDIRDAHKLRFLMQKKYDAETKLMEPRKSVHDKLTSQTDGMRKECEMQSKALKEYRRILTESRRKLAIIRKNVNRDRLRRYGFSVFMKCMMADLEKLTADGGNDNSRQIGRDATDFYHRYVHLEQIGSINSPPKGYITDKQVSVELEDFVSKTITNLPILINVDTLEFTESGAVASVEIKDKIAELIMEKIGYQDFNRDAARHRQYFDRSMIELKDRMIKSNDMVKRERYKMIQERYETLGEMADVKKARL